jgi:MFS family permease
MTPRSERARGITLTRFAMGIGFVIAAITGGVFLYYGIPYETLFMFAMLFIVLAVLIAMVLLRVSKDVPVIEDEHEEDGEHAGHAH